MTPSNENSLLPKFSHIYMEKSVRDEPMTQKILARFPKATTIEIDHYKDVFARTKQDFPLQKKTMKLILARKNPPFLYEGADVCHDFGHQHFYHTSSILNCLYNCEYCFLQGMFPSGNLVMFVNTDDFFSEIETRLRQHPVYVSISYESDLLALENVAPFASQWLEFASRHRDLTVELRTKSVNYAAIRHIRPQNNLILAWTLSPEAVVRQYEHDTPSFEQRLACIEKAVQEGWSVRLSFDPVLHVEQWKEHYREMIDRTFDVLPAEKLLDISIGTFRMGKDYLKKMRKENPASPVLHYPYEAKDGVYTYPEPLERELIDDVYQKVKKRVAVDKIYTD